MSGQSDFLKLVDKHQDSLLSIGKAKLDGKGAEFGDGIRDLVLSIAGSAAGGAIGGGLGASLGGKLAKLLGERVWNRLNSNDRLFREQLAKLKEEERENAQVQRIAAAVAEQLTTLKQEKVVRLRASDGNPYLEVNDAKLTAALNEIQKRINDVDVSVERLGDNVRGYVEELHRRFDELDSGLTGRRDERLLPPPSNSAPCFPTIAGFARRQVKQEIRCALKASGLRLILLTAKNNQGQSAVWGYSEGWMKTKCQRRPWWSLAVPRRPRGPITTQEAYQVLLENTARDVEFEDPDVEVARLVEHISSRVEPHQSVVLQCRFDVSATGYEVMGRYAKKFLVPLGWPFFVRERVNFPSGIG